MIPILIFVATIVFVASCIQARINKNIAEILSDKGKAANKKASSVDYTALSKSNKEHFAKNPLLPPDFKVQKVETKVFSSKVNRDITKFSWSYSFGKNSAGGFRTKRDAIAAAQSAIRQGQ